MARSKPFWKSKTLWFNMLIAAGVAIESALPIMDGQFQPQIFFALTITAAIGNAFLRTITDTAVTLK